MLTFQQFLESKKKANGHFGMGTGHNPSKLMKVGKNKTMKPIGRVYSGMNVSAVYPVAKIK